MDHCSTMDTKLHGLNHGGDDGLCHRCRSLNLIKVFEQNALPKHRMILGFIPDLESSPCRLCRLFAEMVPRDLSYVLQPGEASQLPVELRLFQTAEGFPQRRQRPSDSYKSVLGVYPAQSALRDVTEYDITGRLLPQTGYLSLLPHDRAPLNLGVRRIGQDFDLSIARDWISHCDACHGDRCTSRTASEPDQLRVLDCRTRQVAGAPQNCRYAALSYVWGGGSNNVPGSSARVRFEKVVEDSIVVSQALGIDYLWVDKYCIASDDEADRHRQISQMDLIYTNSTVTIIAAAGDGPNHGLSGVNGTPRLPQPGVDIRGHTLASTLPCAKWTITRSIWSTRGWTYQEDKLSRRRIVFTERQVFFECNVMHCGEVNDTDLNAKYINDTDLNANYITTTINERLAPAGENSPDTYTRGDSLDPERYMVYVLEYSRKQFTYPDDILNAFQGIIGALERAHPGSFRTFWAVPMLLTGLAEDQMYANEKVSRSTQFVLSLLWGSQIIHPKRHRYRTSLSRTRPWIPSWSWAAWSGAIYNHGIKMAPLRYKWFTDVRVWLECKADGRQCCMDHDLDEDNDDNSETVSSSVIGGSCRASPNDLYNARIRIEGWTAEIACVLKVDYGRHTLPPGRYGDWPRNEWSAGVRLRHHDRILAYSPLSSWDTALESPDAADAAGNSENNKYLAFLPSSCRSVGGQIEEKQWTGNAMLLRRIDEDADDDEDNQTYERAGLFSVNRFWCLSDDGDLYRLSSGDLDSVPQSLDSRRRTFWLR